MVTFKENNVGSKVLVYFKGDHKAEVERAAQDYLKDYPTAGYMTTEEKRGENMDGGYYIHLWRLANCD